MAQGPLPLDGIRVLDLSGPVGSYGGRLLANAGADVVKVELPAGDELRRQGPFAGRQPGRNAAWPSRTTTPTSAGSSWITVVPKHSACWPSWAPAPTSSS